MVLALALITVDVPPCRSLEKPASAKIAFCTYE